MKLYVELAKSHGLTIDDFARGHWSLYVDVKCEDCGSNYSAPQVGSINGKCLRCGGRCS